MPSSLHRLCVLYIPALDRRRISAAQTPFIADTLERFPSTRIRTQPSTELVPTMISGIWPHQHGIWQVSIRDSVETGSMNRIFDRLPDIVTTTAQCVRHFIYPEYDLPAIPYWRRRRLKQHRFKYSRRQGERWKHSMMAFNGYPTIFKLAGSSSRYRFALDFESFEDHLSDMPGKALQLDFIEFYGLDYLSHWNLNLPEVISSYLRRVDEMADRLFDRCRSQQVEMVLLVDHGQEAVRSSIDICGALSAAAISREEYTYFVEVASTRLWFHTDNAERRTMEALQSVPHIKVFTNRQMCRFDVCFDHNDYGDLYVFSDPGYIFFPHDFYQPLANLFMGLRRSVLRPRIADPTHRGYHGHLPDHPSEEGYMVLMEERFSPRTDQVSLIDIAPTLLKIMDIPQPAYMKGQPAFRS